MSDNNNPQVLGTLDIGDFAPLQGGLNFSNPQDTYLFTVPRVSNTPNDGTFVFDIRGLIALNSSISVAIGRDINDNGIFEPATEQIGQSLSLSSNQFFLLPESFFGGGNFSLYDPNVFLQPGESYFLSLTAQNPLFGSQTYEITGSLNGAVIGAITTDDDSYTCEDGNVYYFDKYTDDLIGQDIRVGVNGLEAGDTVSIAVLTNQFSPVAFLFDENNCNIISVDASSEIVTLGQVDYQVVQIDFIVQEGITYGLTVETFAPGATGNYFVTTNI